MKVTRDEALSRIAANPCGSAASADAAWNVGRSYFLDGEAYRAYGDNVAIEADPDDDDARPTPPSHLTVTEAQVLALTHDAPGTALEAFAATGVATAGALTEAEFLLGFLDHHAETPADWQECVDVAQLAEHLQGQLV